MCNVCDIVRWMPILCVALLAMPGASAEAAGSVDNNTHPVIRIRRVKTGLPWSTVFAVHPQGKVVAILLDDAHDGGCRVELLSVEKHKRPAEILLKSRDAITAVVWSRSGRRLAACSEKDTTLVTFSDDTLSHYTATLLHCPFRAAMFMPDEQSLVGVHDEKAGTAEEHSVVRAVSLSNPAHPILPIRLPSTIYPSNENTPLVACVENAVAVCGTGWRILPDFHCQRGGTLGTDELYCNTAGPVYWKGTGWYLTTVEPTKCVGRGSVFVVQKTILLAQSADGKQSFYLPWPQNRRIYGLQVLANGQFFVTVDDLEDKYGNGGYETREYRIESQSQKVAVRKRRVTTTAVSSIRD